jgi:putative transposase
MNQNSRRLCHAIPAWIEDGARFHLRLRVETGRQSEPLTSPELSPALLGAAELYHRQQAWHLTVFLLMPDHLHAILSVPRVPGLSETIRTWKRATARIHRVAWQENYFDHRLRNDREANEKWAYILRNPVAKGLCHSEEEWPHVWRPSLNP